MKWSALSSILDGQLGVTRLALPSGKVLAGASPADLPRVVEALVETEDDADKLEDNGPTSVLEEARLLDPLLDFYWDGLGATSSAASIKLLHLGGPRSFVCWLPEDDREWAIAALEPLTPTIASAFLRDLVPQNGRLYGVWLFGGLPTRTVNHRPDLIPATVARECYWKWMRSASTRDPGVWATLRDTVVGESEEPDHFRRSLRVLEQFKRLGTPATADAIRRSLDEKEQEGQQLSDPERRLVLDNYFAVSYEEVAPSRL